MEVEKAPKFASLRQEDRQNLLHEGAGSSVMAAYVEIVFDNSDGRLPVESDEVIIRRTVGHKKDEFFLNRKRIQKTEVTSLLESAGFSKSNPYYIVQQGKVANLCTMKDADRLQLLKEVAGTTVYEERRAETMKILQETSLKQEKVNEVLTYIDERLSELEQEKAELTEYEALDKQKKAIEYNIYHKEQSQAQEGLEQVESRRNQCSSDLRNYHNELNAIQEELASEEILKGQQKESLERLEGRLQQKKDELHRNEVARENNLNDILEYENQETIKENEINENNQMLGQINNNISQKETELAEVNQTISQLTTEMGSYANQLISLQSKLEIMINKQSTTFSSPEERNIYITKSIGGVTNMIAEKEELIREYQEHLHLMQTRSTENRNQIQRDERQHEENTRSFNHLTIEINRLLNQRNQLQEDRKKTWQALESANEKILSLKQELSNKKGLLNRTLPYALAQGLSLIENIVAKYGIKGYYGPVIDNIHIKSQLFYKVLDRAGGLGLFHVVVDTDETADLLIKHLESYNAGRLTFLPLNRLRSPHTQYPEETEAKPLIDVAVECADFMEPAVRLIYGGKMLARDLSSASENAARYRIDTFTMDGDRVSARGVMEGGYHNQKYNKIQIVMNIRQITEQIQTVTEEINQLNNRNNSLEEQINSLLKEINKNEIEKDHISDNSAILFKEISLSKKEAKEIEHTIQSFATSIQQVENEVANHRQQIIVYQEELKIPYVDTFTEEDRLTKLDYENQLRHVEESLSGFQHRLNAMQSRQNSIRQDLEQNLYKAREEVEYKIHSLLATSTGSGTISQGRGGERYSGTQSGDVERGGENRDFKAEIDKLYLENQHLDTLIATMKEEVETLTEQVAGVLQVIVERDHTIEKYKGDEQNLIDQINALSKENEKLSNKKIIFIETINNRSKLIKDLGLLSQIEMQNYQSYSVNQLIRELSTVNAKLEKFSNINRKALDQYLSFANQKEILFARQKELNSDSQSIHLLIQNLDVQKDENIVTTFQNVNKHFVNVFTELVPAGKARLVLRTALDSALEEQEGEEGEATPGKGRKETAPDMNNILGIGVEVSFASSSDGRHIYHNMTSLSGGQKALVALGLIFAIQRCDPAPFYLFDEIDQALDSNHRLSVAQLIERQVTTDPSTYAAININKGEMRLFDVKYLVSPRWLITVLGTKEQHYSPPQFITTTFRPELVQVAEKCFGIALQNKVSNIIPLSKEDAQDFVTNLMLEEEAVGTVSAVPTYRGVQGHGNRDEEEEEEEEEEQGELEGEEDEVEEGMDVEEEGE
eukprot:scaffold3414_cov183-Ochromonas_danica.AAC.11